MAINKIFLFEKIKTELIRNVNKFNFDLPITLYLVEKTIFNDPTKDCITKGKQVDWNGLPKTKSLFYVNQNCGLPIGNLTSQLFGNIYLNDFDHFVKRELKIKYYGRYVDDFVLVHHNKGYLTSIIPIIRNFLKEKLQLQLHPDKIYLQHYSKGVKFLGVVIKPYRNYIANRTKGNFYETINLWNTIMRKNKKLYQEEIETFMSSINSYLGIMKHYKTYKIRKKMLNEKLSGYFWNYFYISNGYQKLTLKRRKIK